MQFKSLVCLASAIAVAFGATTQDVLNDIAVLKSQLTTLDNAIKSFPNTGGSLSAALAIHTDATNTQPAIDDTTSDVKAVPTPVSLADGTSILNAINDIRPIIEDALTNIVGKKPAFAALPIGGIPALVKQDLANLSSSTTALENALISSAPPALLSQATALRNEIDAAFATAIAAYA